MATPVSAKRRYLIRHPDIHHAKYLAVTLPYTFIETFARSQNLTIDEVVKNYELECDFGPTIEDGVHYHLVKAVK